MAEVLRFGDFELDRNAYELRRAGRAIRLERIPLDLLFLLAERGGELVSREEILERIWGKGVFIDVDASINAAVRKARRALNDSADAPRFILTVPAKGYRLVSPVHQASAGLSQVRPTASSFVGRQHEVAQLRVALADAAAGRGRLFLISGEPGIGKTRLAEEVAVHAQENRMAVLMGHCSQHAEAVPYLPFVEILETFVDRVAQPEAIRVLVGEEGQELARLLPKLKRMLPELPPLELSPQQARRHLFNCFCDFAARLAREQPTLLILDDLQWADDSSLSLLDHLAQRLQALPLLVVGTYRDAEIDVSPPLARTLEDLMRTRRAILLRLKGLPRDEVALMLMSLSGMAPPTAVVSEIYGETQGNPFFIEELFRYLEEDNRLYEAAGRFRSELKIAELDVPQSVRLVVGRRLARLSDPTQKILGTAAVIGRSFNLAVLAAASGGTDPLQNVQETERCGLVLPHADRSRFEFSHELIRQAVISGLPTARREQLHLEVADAIELIYADDRETHSAELAHHYRLGGNIGKAIDYLAKAAEQAAMRSAHDEAVADFEAALNLLQTLPASRERDHRELDLQIALGAVLTVSRGWAAPEKERGLSRARDLCLRLGDLTRIMPVLAELIGFREQRGEFRTAREMAEYSIPPILAEGEKRGDPQMIAGAHGILGECSFWSGSFATAQMHFGRMFAHAGFRRKSSADDFSLLGAEAGNFEVITQWTTLPALGLAYQGYLDQCRERLGESLARARVQSNVYSLGLALTHYAWGHLLTDRAAVAQSAAEEAIALSKDRGFLERAAIGTCIRGIALTYQESLEEGIAEIQHGLADLGAARCGIFDSWFYCALALACAKAGRLDEGDDALKCAVAVLEQRGESFYQAEVLRFKAERMLIERSANISQAEQSIRAAIDLARCQGARLWELRATTSLARLLRSQGRRDEASGKLAKIHGRFTEGFDTIDLKEAKALLDDLSQ